jgi:hypothetical protein
VIERPRPAPPALPAGTPPFTRLPSVDPEDQVSVQLQKEETATSLRRDGIPEEDIQHLLAGSRKKDQIEQGYLPAAPASKPTFPG